jgi:hypothetical protein
MSGRVKLPDRVGVVREQLRLFGREVVLRRHLRRVGDEIDGSELSIVIANRLDNDVARFCG